MATITQPEILTTNNLKKKLDKIILTYNNELRNMLVNLGQINPKDNDLKIIQNALSLGLQKNESYAIMTMGPVLYNYRKKIQERDTTYFLSQSFTEYSTDKEIQRIITKIKDYWKKLSELEQSVFTDCIITLLIKYLEYEQTKKLLKV